MTEHVDFYERLRSSRFSIRSLRIDEWKGSRILQYIRMKKELKYDLIEVRLDKWVNYCSLVNDESAGVVVGGGGGGSCGGGGGGSDGGLYFGSITENYKKRRLSPTMHAAEESLRTGSTRKTLKEKLKSFNFFNIRKRFAKSNRKAEFFKPNRSYFHRRNALRLGVVVSKSCADISNLSIHQGGGKVAKKCPQSALTNRRERWNSLENVNQ